MKIAYATMTVLAAALALAGCSKDTPAPPVSASDTPETLVAAAVTNAPWYAERFEKLGFYVFPAPEAIPPFTVKTMSGKAASVDGLAGKVVLLNFWATWCPPCKAEMPSIEALYGKLKDSAFDIMAISVSETPKTVADFLKSNKYTYPIYLDESGEASAPFAGRGIPTTFVLDKQGRAIAGIVGSRSYDGPEVVSLFKELAEKLP